MRRVIVGAVFLMFAVAAASQNVSRDLEKLVERHTQARGGAAAIESVEAIRVRLAIAEPGFRVTGEYVATRTGFARIDIYADGERVFTEVLTPDGGWQRGGPGSEISDLSAGGHAVLERGRVANLYGLHELQSLGYTLGWAGCEESNRGSLCAIDVIAPDGFTERQFFDRESALLVRDDERSALHPDIDPTPVIRTTFRSDFRYVDGVLFSHASRTVETASGKELQSDEITGLEVNPVIDPAIFRRPAPAAGEGAPGS